MSGSAYPYTPYPATERLETSGQAFLGGFGAGQQVNQRAQQMDAQQQLMKLRELEDRRIAEMQPLRVRATQQAIDFAAQNQPFNVDRLRLGNRLTEAQIAQLQTAVGERAALNRALSGMPFPALPSGATTPAPTNTPGVAPPAATRGVLPPEVPAPTAVPGPQSGAPAWLNQQFGERRFTGLQLASAGVNDYTGLPTGMAPPAAEGEPQGPSHGGYYAEDMAAGAYPAPVTPIAPPTAFAPMPPEVQQYLQTQTPDQLRQIIRRGERSFSGSPVSGRANLAEYARQELAQRSTTEAPAPTQVPSQATAAFTPEQMRVATDGRGDQTEMAPQEGGRREAEAPSAPYIVEPARINQDRERLTRSFTRLQAEYRVAVASRNVADASRIAREAEAVTEQLRYLDGMTAITRLRVNDPVPLANAMFDASGGRIQIQPRSDGRFNVFLDGQVANQGVSRDQLEASGRTLFDTQFREQIAQRRTQNAELAMYQAKQRIDQMTRVSAEAVLEEVKTNLKRGAPDMESRLVTDSNGQQSIVIIDKNTGAILRAGRIVTLPPSREFPQGRVTLDPISIR